VPSINGVVGHTKGALVIENAIHGLPREATERLHVVTLGCPIDEGTPAANYSQFLGLFDGLGLLNSSGNRPDTTIPSHHSTNKSVPAEHSGLIAHEARDDARGAAATRNHV
jgi:hypothetical protein